MVLFISALHLRPAWKLFLCSVGGGCITKVLGTTPPSSCTSAVTAISRSWVAVLTLRVLQALTLPTCTSQNEAWGMKLPGVPGHRVGVLSSYSIPEFAYQPEL